MTKQANNILVEAACGVGYDRVLFIEINML
jgi:hypothetical protein